MDVHRAAAALAVAALACATPGARPWAPFPAGLDERAARETLRRFASALEAGSFAEARELLSARWRASYDPARLELDFAGNAAAREMARAVLGKLAAGAPIERIAEGKAILRLDGARGAALVAEGGAWRIEALE